MVSRSATSARSQPEGARVRALHIASFVCLIPCMFPRPALYIASVYSVYVLWCRRLKMIAVNKKLMMARFARGFELLGKKAKAKAHRNALSKCVLMFSRARSGLLMIRCLCFPCIITAHVSEIVSVNWFYMLPPVQPHTGPFHHSISKSHYESKNLMSTRSQYRYQYCQTVPAN